MVSGFRKSVPILKMGLFDLGDNQPSINAPVLPETGEWDGKQFLTFEKESLGFYLSGHPLSRYEEVLDKFTNANAISIKDLKDGGRCAHRRACPEHQKHKNQKRGFDGIRDHRGHAWVG